MFLFVNFTGWDFKIPAFILYLNVSSTLLQTTPSTFTWLCHGKPGLLEPLHFSWFDSDLYLTATLSLEIHLPWRYHLFHLSVPLLPLQCGQSPVCHPCTVPLASKVTLSHEWKWHTQVFSGRPILTHSQIECLYAHINWYSWVKWDRWLKGGLQSVLRMCEGLFTFLFWSTKMSQHEVQPIRPRGILPSWLTYSKERKKASCLKIWKSVKLNISLHCLT